MSTSPTSLADLRIDRGSLPKKERPAWLWPVVLIILALIGLLIWWFARPKPLVVETAPVAEQSSSSTSGNQTLLNASGYVTARRQATVSSKITARVSLVKVEEGMVVKKDQVLAELDSSNISTGLHLAEAQLDVARKALDETMPNLEFARQEATRFSDLAKAKVTSQSDYRRALAASASLEATLAREKAQVAVAEAGLADWKQQMEDTIIRAPFDGVVTVKNAQPGEIISPISSGGFTRTGICTIVDMSSLEIDVDVSESYINRVEPDAPVEAVLDSYPDTRFPAKVIAIIPTADRQKATVKVRVGFDHLDPRILPDMGVKVAFQSTPDEKNATPTSSRLVIPTAAVSTQDNRDIVWVVREGKVERRAITIARIDGEKSMVAAGLRSGENVVLNPPASLQDGVRVIEK